MLECEPTLVAFGDGKYGRECLKPFVCDAQAGCICPLSVGGLLCERCRVGVSGAACLLCDRKRSWLVHDKCKKFVTCR